ncbi:MAG: SPFH domain-containing protein [Angelakisella sp.]|nr:SPFH domain-containing protein [Angelakisella sp.]
MENGFNGFDNKPPMGPKPGFFKRLGRNAFLVVLALVLVSVAASSFTVIDEGFVGVKYQFGRIVDASLTAGLNFKLPFVETITKVDVREQMYEASTTAYTKDTQTVENLQVKLNYIYDKSSLENLIRNVGIFNVESKLIIPQIQSVMKNEIGQVRAEDLVQSRTTVQETIEDKLRDNLSTSGIIVLSFAIENIDFEDGFEEAIRAKVVAEQEALKMQNKTKEKEELARQIVIEAEAEAESSKIRADAEAYAIEAIQKQLQASPEYIELQKVQKWNGEYPQVMGNNVNPFVTLD